jgi:hypothetical protein
MPTVVFVLGLCGSGKSTRARALAFDGFVNFDEQVTGRPIHPDTQAWPGSAFSEFVQAVADGKDCVATEILFFHRAWQEFVIQRLANVRADVVIRWECFDPSDWEIANHNCAHDPTRSPEGIRANLAQNANTLQLLRSGAYELPPGHVLLRTVRR